MHSMERVPGKARDLHLYVGQNALAQDAGDFIDCIATGKTPSHLTMRMVDYPREEPFQELIRALAVNKTLVYLDMSKISLPYEAGEKTSFELENLFAKNTTLRELDISGEQAVLESASLGSGLLKPLGRIAENKSLEVLRIECKVFRPGAPLQSTDVRMQCNHSGPPARWSWPQCWPKIHASESSTAK